MHEPNHLLHELHVVESERDQAIRERDHARALACRLEQELEALGGPNLVAYGAHVVASGGVAVYSGQGLA